MFSITARVCAVMSRTFTPSTTLDADEGVVGTAAGGAGDVDEVPGALGMGEASARDGLPGDEVALRRHQSSEPVTRLMTPVASAATASTAPPAATARIRCCLRARSITSA